MPVPVSATILGHQFSDTLYLDPGIDPHQETSFSIPFFAPGTGSLNRVSLRLVTDFASETLMRVTSATTEVVFEYRAINHVAAQFEGFDQAPEDLLAEHSRPQQTITKPLAADVLAGFDDGGRWSVDRVVEPETLGGYVRSGTWNALVAMSDHSRYWAGKPSGAAYLFTFTRGMTTDVRLQVTYDYTPPGTDPCPAGGNPWDIDCDGNANGAPLLPDRDGLLFLRERLGLRAGAMLEGVIVPGDGAKRRTPEQIGRAFADTLGEVGVCPPGWNRWDIDCNGDMPGNSPDALTDALLFLRYAAGLRGDDLVRGAVAPDCRRCSARAVEAYLGTNL